MKTHELNNVIVNKNIETAFNILCVNDNNIISSNVTNIVDWQQFPWEEKKGIKRQTDIFTLKIDTLPELYYGLLEDDSNRNIKIQMIKKVAFKTNNKYIVTFKYKIMNLKYLVQTIIDKLQLIRMKCKVYLLKESETSTKLSLKMKTSAFVPYAFELEDYIIEYAKQIMNTIISVMQS